MINTKYKDQETLNKARKLFKKKDYQGAADFLNANIDNFNEYSDNFLIAGCLTSYCLELVREGKNEKTN